MNQPIRVCVSGYFDPLHIGHLEYLQYAKMDGLGLKVQSSSWLTGLKSVISNKEDTNTVVETKEEEDSS